MSSTYTGSFGVFLEAMARHSPRARALQAQILARLYAAQGSVDLKGLVFTLEATFGEIRDAITVLTEADTVRIIRLRDGERLVLTADQDTI